MKTTTELERRKAAMLKTARTAIRLKHSLAADAEISERLPKLEERIDAALANGEGFELTAGQIFDEA